MLVLCMVVQYQAAAVPAGLRLWCGCRACLQLLTALSSHWLCQGGGCRWWTAMVCL